MKGETGVEVGGETSIGSTTRKEVKRGISILDLVLRIITAIGTLGSVVAMATTNQTLSVTQFLQFRAQYNDLPTFTFFVIANSIVCGYLIVLSLPLSIFHMISRSAAKSTRIILVVFDTVALALVTAGASAATTIVYLAHKGNAKANWPTVCQPLSSFCQRISGSLIGSYGAALALLLLLIITSTFTTSQRPN